MRKFFFVVIAIVAVTACDLAGIGHSTDYCREQIAVSEKKLAIHSLYKCKDEWISQCHKVLVNTEKSIIDEHRRHISWRD